MGPPITVLDAYEEAFDLTPAQLVATGRTLTEADLTALLDARTVTLSTTRQQRGATEIWPLVSHHTYGDRALFGGRRGDLLPRALTLMLLHDGLVVADPLDAVHRVLTTVGMGSGVSLFARATSELAEVEALIAARVLRFTPLRPALGDSQRSAVLTAFGLTPELQVFTDFLEALGGSGTIPGSFQRALAPQVRDLYRRFGLDIAVPRSSALAERRIGDLAAAVIEVSWQFAVAAEDPGCDLAFRGALERHLAEAIFEEGLGRSPGPGRHLATLDLGRVPNLVPDALTLADALAIRTTDAFEGFRASVRSSLDDYEAATRAGSPISSAQAVFEEAMQDRSRVLRETVTRASFSERIREGALPAALGVVAELTLAPMGPAPAAAAAGSVSVATLLWQWLVARRKDGANAVCHRYLSMLGGEGTQP